MKETQAGALIVGVEWMRLVACLGIVAFHAHVPGELVALGGLHAFTAAMVAFSMRSARNRPLSRVVRARLSSLILPWLVWGVFYAGFFGVMRHRHGEDPFAWIRGAGILMGPAYHLWFLPFAFLVGLALYPISRGVRRLYAWVPPDLVWWIVFVLALVVAAREAEAHHDVPFDQWLSVLPCIPVGVALADIAPGMRSRLFALWIALPLVAALALGFGHTAIPLLSGLPLTVLAFNTERRSEHPVFAWSRLSMGVYLLHPFFARLALGALGSRPVALFAVVALLSLGATALLRRTPLRAIL